MFRSRHRLGRNSLDILIVVFTRNVFDREQRSKSGLKNCSVVVVFCVVVVVVVVAVLVLPQICNRLNQRVRIFFGLYACSARGLDANDFGLVSKAPRYIGVMITPSGRNL